MSLVCIKGQAMKEEQEYIYSIPKFNKKSSPDNTQKMLEMLKNPCRDRKIIHVAGTNGKGSVCNYIDNILRTAGKKTGLFTSPHLVRINERIAVCGREVTDREVEKAFYRVKEVAEKMVAEGLVHPSFFEFLFGMAMMVFEESDAEYIILETGLGGRLDATNIIEKPVLTVITSISYDHTDILGGTLTEIAGEKAGIIKAGVPLVFEDKNNEVTKVIKDRAEALSSPLYILKPEDICNVSYSDKNIDFSLDNGYYCNVCFKLATTAAYQPENASLALICAKVLGINDEAVLKEGLLNTFWQGRMQEVMPGVVVDGAHNEDGIRRFLESVKMDFCLGKRLLLFSAVKDKHYEDMISQVCKSGLFSAFYTATIDDARGLSADIIHAEFEKYGVTGVRVLDSNPLAFKQALLDKQDEDRLYVVGSLYLAGEILGCAKGENHD